MIRYRLTASLRRSLLAIALSTQVPHTAWAAALQINLPAQPLGRSLAQLARQANLQLLMPPDATRNLQAPALQGTMEMPAALELLLRGNGLRGRVEGNTLLIEPAPAARQPAANAELPVVQVTAKQTEGTANSAYASKSAGVGVLGEKSLKDTPYSIEVYSRELLDNKQARSLADATRGDASVSLSYGNLITENNGVAIRGISPDFYTGSRIDGMTTRVRAADLPLEHFESIEILKGASAFLYGFGAPGGVVNYTLKRGTDEPVRRLSTQVMDSGLLLLHGDVGGRAGPDGAFGYRVNLLHEEGDTYVDRGESRRRSGSVALDWRITPDLVWRVDALAARHMRYGGYWALIPNGDGLADNWGVGAAPAPIDGSRRLAPSFSTYGSRQQTYGTRLDWQFAADWNFTLAHRRSENGRQFLAPAIFADAQGNYSMRFWNYANRFESDDSQATFSGHLQTGPIGHDVVIGTSRTKTRSLNISGDTLVMGSGNLSDPIEFTNPFTRIHTPNDADSEFDLVRRRELFASDTLHLGTDWDVILGLRHGRLENRYSGYNRSANTPTLAAVYRPLSGMSVYASYVEALEEGALAPDTAANAGQAFPPLVSKQYELGVKAEGSDWTATAAAFRLQRGLTYTTADNVFTQDGEARYQGLELSAKIRLNHQWLAMASFSLLDATSQKTTDGALDGKRVPGLARQQLAGYTEYRFSGLPLTLTAGARYVGKQPLDPENRWRVSAVTLLDVGARYEARIGRLPLTLRLNIENLADKAYWVTQSEGNTLMQGAPRTVKLGAQIDF